LVSKSKVGRSSRDARESMVESRQAAWRGCPDRRRIGDVRDTAKRYQGVGDKSGMQEAKWFVVIAADGGSEANQHQWRPALVRREYQNLQCHRGCMHLTKRKMVDGAFESGTRIAKSRRSRFGCVMPRLGWTLTSPYIQHALYFSILARCLTSHTTCTGRKSFSRRLGTLYGFFSTVISSAYPCRECALMSR
jgi:hypothetical protein